MSLAEVTIPARPSMPFIIGSGLYGNFPAEAMRQYLSGSAVVRPLSN